MSWAAKTAPVPNGGRARGAAIASAWATIAGLALDHGPIAEIYRIRRDARVTAGLVPGAAEPEARLLADALLLWERAAAAAATDPAAALRAGRLRALVLQATDLVLAVAAGGGDGEGGA